VILWLRLLSTLTVDEAHIPAYVQHVTRHISGHQASIAKELIMLKEHTLPQTRNNPTAGEVTANVKGDQSFKDDGFNFAYDYYTTDSQLRLTLSAAQTYEAPNGTTVVRGIEMVFNADTVSGTHKIEDKKVSATYWKMWAENGDTRFQTFDADTGSVNLEFDHEKETYEGNFAFKSSGPGATALEIDAGRFSVKGRDNFML
jgi:chitinase